MAVKKVVVRSAYFYDADQVSKDTALLCMDPSLAVQSQKEESDINTIVKRFGLTGLPPKNLRTPLYGDFTEVFDFQSALEAVNAAKQAFFELPWEMRARFGNDPHAWVGFSNELTPDGKDFANRAEMEKMGMIVPKEVAKEVPPMKVEVVNPTELTPEE